MIDSRCSHPYAPPRFVRLLLVGFTLVLCAGMAGIVHGQCGSSGPGGFAPNVFWDLKDSVTACPAGDTLTALNFPASVGPRPCKLRIRVFYYDANDCPKVGVPPESIWVTTSTATGNLRVNDAASQIFADDSTDASGFARITISSFSGCGKMSVSLKVSGASEGSKNATVRTADTLSDGRVDQGDFTAGLCDLNYDNIHGQGDEVSSAAAHTDHWHRNVLFGTLVRRTNLCEACAAESTGTIGESEVFWSPDGKRLAFTVHNGPIDSVGVAPCMVFLARSDPREGNTLTQFTFPDSDLHDYDPSWSPLGDVIAFDRHDRRILRKGIPGVDPDTSLYLITAGGDLNHSGDVTPGISPDGQWVAFSRADSLGPRNIWKVAISGGTATKLTNDTTGVDFYPQWSSDGNWIIFDRQIGPSDQPHHAYKVKSNGDSLQSVYDAPSGHDAATPAFSPDGAIVTLAVGTHATTNPPRDVTTRTLDPALATKKVLAYFTDSTFADKGPDPVLTPRLSPDGTRLALRSKQVWAARRNMSQPPQFTSVDGQSVADSTARVFFTMLQGLNYTITVAATDPEGDALTYAAYFLQLGMTFDPATRTFSWTPPTGTVGNTYYVRFQVGTASGGTDAIIAVISVQQASKPSRAGLPSGPMAIGPNPTRGSFGLVMPYARGLQAVLDIYDVTGRRLATVRGPAGRRLEWDGRAPSGALVPPGMYLYRIQVGGEKRNGTFTLLR